MDGICPFFRSDRMRTGAIPRYLAASIGSIVPSNRIPAFFGVFTRRIMSYSDVLTQY